MSAYMVDNEHINVMIWAAERYSSYGPLRWYYGNPTFDGVLDSNRNEVGQMLVDANQRSVNHRYNETTPSPTYRYQQPKHLGWSIGELLHAIDGYEYEASEPRDWSDSEARAFCQALRGQLIKHVAGYEQGPWTITTADEPLSAQTKRSA